MRTVYLSHTFLRICVCLSLFIYIYIYIYIYDSSCTFDMLSIRMPYTHAMLTVLNIYRLFPEAEFISQVASFRLWLTRSSCYKTTFQSAILLQNYKQTTRSQ